MTSLRVFVSKIRHTSRCHTKLDTRRNKTSEEDSIEYIDHNPVGCNMHLTNEIIPFMHTRISICDPCIINLKETLLSIIWNGSVMDHSGSMSDQYLLSISHPCLGGIGGGTFLAHSCMIIDLRTLISVSFLLISRCRFESRCIN